MKKKHDSNKLLKRKYFGFRLLVGQREAENVTLGLSFSEIMIMDYDDGHWFYRSND